MLSSSNPKHPTELSNHPVKLAGLSLAVCAGIATVLIATSPNFHSLPGTRSAPLGGDFLQDWAGGHIVQSKHRHRLYDQAYFSSVQHDHQLVGFQWQKNKWYPPVYSPGYYFLLSPLAKLNYTTAVYLWLAISLLALAITFSLLNRFYPESSRLLPWLILGSLLYSPLLFALNIGHKSTFLLLALTITFLLFRHNRRASAGLAFGLLAFKPQLTLVLLAVMIWRRQWKFLGGFLLSCVGWLALCLATHVQLTADYADRLLQSSHYAKSPGYDQALGQNLWNVTELATGDAGWPIAELLAALLALAIIGIVFKSTKRLSVEPSQQSSPARDLEFDQLFAISVVATVLVSPHFFYYDLTILLLPLLIAGTLADKAVHRGWQTWTALGMFCLPGACLWLAQTTNVHVSVPLITLWLFMLCRIRLPNEQPSDTFARIQPAFPGTAPTS